MFYELNIDPPPICLSPLSTLQIYYPAFYAYFCLCVCVCPGAQQQQPAVFEVCEPGGCRPVRMQGHRAPDWRGRD